jgi:outer membrane protein assembly factor BamB
MLCRCLAFSFLISLTVAPQITAAADPPGYRPLFDGQSLAGWEGAGQPAEKCWKAEDGAIVCTGEKGTWLRSKERFDDFNLRLEYKLKPGGNSGVYIRVPENGTHHGDGAGIEVQVLDDGAERYRTLKPYQYTGSLYAIAPATQHVAKQPGTWNSLEINCRGTKYHVIHNGTQIIAADETTYPELKGRLTKGFLGLQNHNEEVWFRNIRIGPPRDLPVDPPPADWSQFRGPAGNGHAAAKHLPTTWNESTNVAWKTEIPGKGWSSPSLHRNRLYLTTAVPVEASDAEGPLSLRTLCIDATNGHIIWNVEVFQQEAGAPKIHSKNSHASPTALVDDGHIYVHFGHQGTACLDLNGKIIWKDTSHTYEPVHGNGGSPLLVGQLLIFSCDGADNPFVVALDTKTGDEKWRFDRTSDAENKFSFSTPTLIEVNGKQQFITPGSGVVNALDPQTGREIWHVNYGDGYSVIPKPVYGHGLLFVATGYNTPNVIAIRPEGASGDVTDTNVVWTIKKAAPHTPSLLLVGNELYFVSDKGVATCVDALTGHENWSERIGGAYSASPLFADGKIYLQAEDGNALVLEPGTKFTKIADTGFKERTLASYAVGDDCLFIRTEKHLYRVQQK